jgi:hypothetical protein
VKVISFIPLIYSRSGAFWDRDLGLVTLGLQELGVDGLFAALQGDSPEQGRPLLTPTISQARDSSWWRDQQPDAVILNAWGVPRHDGVRKAVCSLGCPVIEKLDTDGVKSPRIYPTHSLRRSLVDYDRTNYLSTGLRAQIYGLAKFFISLALPSTLDKRIIRCMRRVPMFAAETPLAAERVRRFFRIYSVSPAPAVVTIPHPVQTDYMTWPAAEVKRNQVVAVGRWHDAVKGWPLLQKVAGDFLSLNPTWSVVVVGPGSIELGQSMASKFPGRFHGAGSLPHRELAKVFCSSKVYLLCSHSETFNIAAAEALCCGCSLVGPTQIASAGYFTSMGSGTVSHLRSRVHMLDALRAEVGEWEHGRRDPVSIAKAWREEVGYRAVAQKYLNIFHAFPARNPILADN